MTRTKLLVQILAVLGVSSVACSKGVVTPDKPTDDPKACPNNLGDSAVWPSGTQRGNMDGNEAVCLPMPANGDCASYPQACVLSAYGCGLVKGGNKVVDKLPSKEPKTCCWHVQGGCAVGRPFVVEGAARLAPVASGDGWNMHASLSVELNAVAADVWARDGLIEHASVASFAQLVLELLALGAPADLVTGAQEAMADEIRHAQRAFMLASRYAGAPVAPGPLDIRGSGAVPSLADFAARAASEGCIAETIAALQLHAAADAAANPAIAALLRQTAEEESRHALLAYRIVAWAIGEGGEAVRDSVAAVFATAASHVGFGPCPADDEDLRAHGILSRRERHDLAALALREVVAPAGASLLGPTAAVSCTL
jgi:hypothetical protein